MDLSKAFHCLPKDILLSKLSEYGLSNDSVKLLKSSLTDGKQQAKLSGTVSSWSVIKRCPKGYHIRPMFVYFFINALFYFLKYRTCYKYADDNTVSSSTPDFDELIQVLQSESQMLLDWFQDNYMQTNPDKLQAIATRRGLLVKI